MESFEITLKELKRLQFMDNAIKNYKTREQREIIEMKEQEKLKKEREVLRKQIIQRINKEAKTIWVNSVMKFMSEEELTDMILEAEVEAWVDYYIRNK